MTPGQPPAIEFRNVSISFDGAPALQNISFTLARGEMIKAPAIRIPANRYCCGSRSVSCGRMKARF